MLAIEKLVSKIEKKNYGILELSNFANFFNVVIIQTFPNISVQGGIIIFCVAITYFTDSRL